MSTAITKTVTVEGWALGFVAESEEPRVRDLDLAVRLGYARPREVRALIRSLRSAGKLNPFEVRGVAPQTSGRPATEFWLTESEALKITAKSGTNEADAILDALIAVFIAYRNGTLATRPIPLDATIANSARIGDSPVAIEDLRRAVRRARLATGYSAQRIHGFIRRTQKVGSVFDVSAALLTDVERALRAIEDRHVQLLSGRQIKLLAAADKQLKLSDEKGWH